MIFVCVGFGAVVLMSLKRANVVLTVRVIRSDWETRRVSGRVLVEELLSSLHYTVSNWIMVEAVWLADCLTRGIRAGTGVAMRSTIGTTFGARIGLAFTFVDTVTPRIGSRAAIVFVDRAIFRAVTWAAIFAISVIYGAGTRAAFRSAIRDVTRAAGARLGHLSGVKERKEDVELLFLQLLSKRRVVVSGAVKSKLWVAASMVGTVRGRLMLVRARREDLQEGGADEEFLFEQP